MTFKKLAFGILCFAVCVNSSYAGTFYFGPALEYESVQGDVSSYQAISPRLTVGYAENMGFPYYLGGEIFAVAGNIDGHPDDSGLKNTPTYGISAIPGVLLTQNTFVYGRLGVVSTNFSEADSYTWGGQVGVGVETAITQTWDVRTEYIFTQYGDISANGIAEGRPYSNAVALGVIHRFQ